MSDELPQAPAAPIPSPEPSASAGEQRSDDGPAGDGPDGGQGSTSTRSGAARRRRRGSRGGKGRTRAPGAGGSDGDDDDDGDDTDASLPDELPDRSIEGRIQDPEVAAEALVRRPRIGDTRPAPPGGAGAPAPAEPVAAAPARQSQPRKQSDGGRPVAAKPAPAAAKPAAAGTNGDIATDPRKKRRRGGKGRGAGPGVVEAVTKDLPVELDESVREARRGRIRNGKPVGRYLMCVHVSDAFTQIAVLEGRNLIEHYVSRPSDDTNQIHGNVYLGKVTNVLPGMEAAFVDIGTPKNAVLYMGDVQYDAEDVVERGEQPRIEQVLKPRQTILSQVTKNPIGAKGARLTQEVSLPGRFVVLIPNSGTYGISKRLDDAERKRLRSVLDQVKPAQHGIIVRTAAEGVTASELQADVRRLVSQWEQIEALAARSQAPKLLYREPLAAVRVIREEFNRDYRGVIIDDRALYEDVRDYVNSISPELTERIHYFDPAAEGLPLFESERVHEQVVRALDRKVWLPSGGSLIIEHTEALTVIDVNTGKNVGSSSLEETVFRNNLEAAEEIARQLRLRDIGGIIVIDFIDMEIRDNRRKVVEAFRDALSRDKTRTQVFDISDLGLVEMTRKRIGEGLLTAFAVQCEMCHGRGVVVQHDLI